jgi:hypothetical protein
MVKRESLNIVLCEKASQNYAIRIEYTLSKILRGSLAGVLLFFQLHLRLLSALEAEFLKLAEIGLLGLHNANAARSSATFGAEAGVDGALSSWHS